MRRFPSNQNFKVLKISNISLKQTNRMNILLIPPWQNNTDIPLKGGIEVHHGGKTIRIRSQVHNIEPFLEGESKSIILLKSREKNSAAIVN